MCICTSYGFEHIHFLIFSYIHFGFCLLKYMAVYCTSGILKQREIINISKEDTLIFHT